MKAKKSFRFWLAVGIVLITALFTPISNGTFAMVSNVYENCNENPEVCSEENISEDNATDADAENTESASVSIGFWDYIKVLIALVFVLGLLLFILKYLNKRNSNYQQNAVVKNIGGLSVGQQKSVQLLLIGKSVYVVGVGDNIQLLKEIDSEEEIEQLLSQTESNQNMMKTSPYIAELFKKFSKKNRPEDISNSPKFNDMFNEKIGEIKKQRSNELERWKERERDER
ncbi:MULTISPECIES: flagellar biosynthetic protein FliO [Solibacillus]|uniref:Flagellar biosynthetic protein FliO n=1 Tax=Solibacillus merdavium TaxID=2762218 RepID=A0ABR8XIL3_9BACL|nr:flagellar biosynthetic protein FliO [Solibacillus merdavium]MBD8031764.1 flagellar biosynthetic protein FliO [Solibacillus merdavium]